ncbi:hypothetical protein HYT05_02005 [Candidatus Kaiserbacteria bacterium]|nr:hypothetical protein [Candidatus Kaiserbacteria bacterium]
MNDGDGLEAARGLLIACFATIGCVSLGYGVYTIYESGATLAAVTALIVAGVVIALIYRIIQVAPKR